MTKIDFSSSTPPSRRSNRERERDQSNKYRSKFNWYMAHFFMNGQQRKKEIMIINDRCLRSFHSHFTHAA